MKLTKPKLKSSSVKLDKTQSTILVTVVITTIVAVFCLTSAKVLLGQAFYQQRVINARNASAKQLNEDVKNASVLSDQYNKVFLGGDAENIIGGKSTSSDTAVPPDGDNGKIVLDALPTTYDFPALLTSMSKLLANDGIGSAAIGGSDQATTIDSSPTYRPSPAPINLTVNGSTTYSGAKQLLTDLERSIRPFDITRLSLTGNASVMSVSMDLTTYYQPAKTLTIPSKEIK